MLVLKKKYTKLVDDYNFLVDIKEDWKYSYNQMQSNNVKLEQRIGRLEKELDKADDEVLDLKLERDMYKERNKELRDKFNAIHSELEKVDRIVLQYEQQINELEEKEMTKYVEVTKLIDWSRDPELLEIGKVYKVVKNEELLYSNGVSIYVNENKPEYYLRSDQFKYVEQKEEEKEMTKYAKITKYLGPHNIDKRLGLEIGKTYKIVEYKTPLTDNCYIYLNDEYPYYFISERQYELVEKEETPTFKTTIDLKSSVQAKIDSLTTEAEHLFKKRDRLEQQAINLSKKARKLNKLIESIKEFE